VNESQALHAATAALTRLDERLRDSPLAEVFRSRLATSEAIAIAQAERLGVREIDLVGALNEADTAINDKGIRTARDIRKAVSVVFNFKGGDPPGAERIAAVFNTSESSNTRRNLDVAIATIDTDSDDLATMLGSITSPDPWTAAETMRRVYAGTRFLGKSRRVALMLSPWLASSGFGTENHHPACARHLYALSTEGAQGVEATAADEDKWPSLYFSALAESGQRAATALSSIARLAVEARSLIGARRNGSRILEAPLVFIAMPILSIHDVANQLDVTYNGAKLIIEELRGYGLVAPRDEKGHLFVYAKALNL
jgi:hypothetical protein